MTTDITALTPEKLAEIRQRYTPITAPKCHICGAEMTIGAMSASRIVYACSGATYDDDGCHYAPGRSIADDHYAQSRVTVVDVSDPDVLALVEALESEKRICATWRKTAEANSEKLEKAQAKADVYDMLRDDYGLREKGVGLADFVDWQANRIAELESRTVKLPLPSCTYADHSYPAYSKRQVISLLESLGITVVEGDV
ncbi:TPA: ead/Ea22-like family protein [Klebsiella variicola subsp. variicola]|uniref:ead/Ea22-like family protein n=1 Tax=Klebsiella pneumoniae complex TaxID=3390273 RepID=UPI0015606263|nr:MULTISPECIES: ead/Ea22-like family protein [Klebsiella]HCI6019902.1 ead/Ea22-like family protein [Klebsiella quasipneumoniae subsp. quasipneumoniae]HCM6936248.1 ead/Ea22-like family protein [Klebsiella quasipneumoniae subsp. similipneumoniae]HED2969653.1 ead/Ea22-like family protein [Klebsiella variicola subsp. variicola]MDE8419295.1 ead/Ea22-like family protein [Klebsiella pneumoniae]MDO0834367.1 ead/Ea22-like family protein [Klebsiella pneumoniae]